APDYADCDIGRYYWLAPHRVTVRIGDAHALRFSRDGFDSAGYDRALTALRTLAPQWPVPAQLPLVHVPPTAELAVPWDVVPWFEGTSASRSPLSADGAVMLGLALRAIHEPAPVNAPRHPLSSAPLVERSREF